MLMSHTWQHNWHGYSALVLWALAVGASGGCATVTWKAPSLATLGGESAPPRTTPPPIKGGELTSQESAEACIAAARELESHGRHREAVVLYERARTFQKDAKGVARRLAVLYDRQDDVETARREYARALAEGPKDAELLNNYGFFHYRRGDHAAAEQALREAVRLDPNHERAWINLGFVLGEQRRYPECLEAFGRVLSPAAAQSNLGILLAQQGQLDPARAAFRQALALEPGLKQPRAMLAHLDQRLSNGGAGQAPMTASAVGLFPPSATSR